MALYYIIIFALIQGVTEFLPISSSGHLVLAHHLIEGSSNWGQDLMIDVAVHVGTLASVLLYFRADVGRMCCGLLSCFKRECGTSEAKLLFHVLISSLPVIIAGYVLYTLEPAWVRSLHVMAWTTFLFGILLWWVDTAQPAERTLDGLTLKDAILIGLSQMLALIPGTSRSGITMTAARWTGFTRIEAARFSLLLSIIAISGAGTLGGISLIGVSDITFSLDVLLASAFAFLSGTIAIHLMMQWLSKASFAPFAVYRIGLGLALLVLLYKDAFV